MNGDKKPARLSLKCPCCVMRVYDGVVLVSGICDGNDHHPVTYRAKLVDGLIVDFELIETEN